MACDSGIAVTCLALLALTLQSGAVHFSISLPPKTYTALPDIFDINCVAFSFNSSDPVYAFVTEATEARAWLASSQLVPPVLTASYGSCAGATFCEWESNLLFAPFNYTLVILNPHKAVTQAVVTGLSTDKCTDPLNYHNEAYDLGIEFPGNTVSVMVPFNGTDEMQLNVTYSNGVDIGVMKLSSFQQWNASGLTTKAPFLPGSRTSVSVNSDPDAFSNWTIGGLSPQSSYVAVLQTASSTSGRVAMSAYPGLPQDIDLLIPSKTRIAYGPFNKTTCLSYQYNGSAPITAGILTNASIYSWDPSSASSIPDVVGTGCITQNCTIKATRLAASTSYWVFFLNTLPEAVKVFTIYATGCSVGTEELLEYQSLVTMLVDDQISFGYALNLTDNEGMQPASRKLLAPAAPAAATPTVYALPIGHKLPYQYLAAQDLNSTTAELSPIFDISPSEEPPSPESPVSSPTEEPSSPEESSAATLSETPSESPPEYPELSPSPEADGQEMSPYNDGGDTGDDEDTNAENDSDIPTIESDPALSLLLSPLGG
ncbi:TPA: hypothetical protein ACH3X1_005349 [Trebouxia sp. C0004]